MLDGMMRLLPTAEVGFLGMVRNEETLEASTYAERLPDDLSGRQCYVLDPMLATGGTLAAAIHFLVDRGADHITAICLLSAPEGCARLEKELEGLDIPVTVVTAGMDERLNEKGYIVPGLGDAGDRLYGVVGLSGSEAEDGYDARGDQHHQHEDHDARGPGSPSSSTCGRRRTRGRRSGGRRDGCRGCSHHQACRVTSSVTARIRVPSPSYPL